MSVVQKTAAATSMASKKVFYAQLEQARRNLNDATIPEVSAPSHASAERPVNALQAGRAVSI